MRTIRIVCCILACIFIAAAIPLGAIFGWGWFFILAAIAAIFALGMLWAKKKSEPALPPSPDFMNSDEENAKRREALEEYHREHDNISES